MNLSRLACILTIPFTLAGCGTALVNHTMEGRSEPWSFRLERLAEGPNDVRRMGYTVYSPKGGEHFIQAFLKIANTSRSPLTFGYNACDLDWGNDVIVPSLVVRYNGVASKMDDNEEYAAGEQKARHLVFSYPDGKRPTRLRCGDATFGPIAAEGG